jgi:hypothetical protein
VYLKGGGGVKEWLSRRRVKGNLGNLSYDVSNHHIKSTTSSSSSAKEKG